MADNSHEIFDRMKDMLFAICIKAHVHQIAAFLTRVVLKAKFEP